MGERAPVRKREPAALRKVLDELGHYVESLADEGVTQVESTLTRPSAARRPAAVSAKSPGPARPAAVPPPAARPAAARPVAATSTGGARSVESELARIASEAALCTKCVLHKTRRQAVPGQGALKPELMFVGEAPGADEDAQGLAFVGAAGQLLTRMIEAMGYTRDEVFIANILKCRPPGNRTPQPDEMATCLPYLCDQIRALQPRVIVALGAVATRGLLNTEAAISKLRGHWFAFEGIDVIPTFHPAYLLRNPSAKKDTWADLQEALRRLGRTPPPVPRKS
jgi:DNA polymerase